MQEQSALRPEGSQHGERVLHVDMTPLINRFQHDVRRASSCLTRWRLRLRSTAVHQVDLARGEAFAVAARLASMRYIHVCTRSSTAVESRSYSGLLNQVSRDKCYYSRSSSSCRSLGQSAARSKSATAVWPYAMASHVAALGPEKPTTAPAASSSDTTHT
eukprot:COSAG01_NODE_6610_length_3578_cov_2.591549_2_plen_160_part_00